MTKLTFTEAIPLSLYIHFPWCVKKCPYCDFNSHAIKSGGIPEANYIQALLDDLNQSLPLVWGRKVSSFFLGGGTPSLFTAESIDQLLTGIRARLPLTQNVEITMEANPGTIEPTRFQAFRDAGINRLSLGIQSFDDVALQQLGRIHDSKQAKQAIEAAQKAGFENFNLDLMFGLPGQTFKSSQADLEQAIAYSPQHLSFYQLTLEPNTSFAHHPPKLPNDELLWDIQEAGHLVLQEAGYHQYEVSAFSQTSRECKHNRNYWAFGDYLGIGAGAHGKLTDITREKIIRQTKLRQPEQYLKAQSKVSSHQPIAEKDLPFEFMLNALRLTSGFDKRLFSERTGLGWEIITPIINRLIEDKLIKEDQTKVYPTTLGRRFVDEMTQRFLPHNNS